MGQSASNAATAEYFQLEQQRQHFVQSEKLVVDAFTKCVDAPMSEDATFQLTKQEIMCIKNYAQLYSGFNRMSAFQFFELNNEFMMDMQQKMAQLQAGM